jgi:hypothetical protein
MLYEELATNPPHRKTSPQDMSISMTNHSFSPTMPTATLKIHKVIHYPTRLMTYKPLKVDKGINLRMLGKTPQTPACHQWQLPQAEYLQGPP